MSDDASQKPIRVLLIEDDPQQAELIRQILMGIPNPRYEVRTAMTLKSGLEKLFWEGADVVLLDLTLPDSKGLETWRETVDRCEGAA